MSGDRSPPRSPERERLHASFQTDRHYLPQMLALDSRQRSSRVDSILSLKDLIDKSASAIQSQNARRHRHQKAVEAQDAARFQELLHQGKNPYEVARKRQVQAVAQRERQQIEQRIEDKQVAILEHLEVEKVWRQRQEAVTAKQREYEKTYQKELGRSAVEARTQQFLVSRTGKETLDPSGKSVRLFPSQETTLPDHSFGVGRNLVHDEQQRHRIIAKVASKKAHRGVEPRPLLVPRYGTQDGGGGATTSNSNNNAAERALAAVEVSVVPGHELEEMNHSVVDGGMIKTRLPPVDKRRGSSSSAEGAKKPGFGKPKRSVLEERMLVEARARQKTNIVTKQVVWGKAFTGRAFLAEPAVIWFKDYDVGVPMTLTFTLTNVSNTFNHFKLLDLDEKIKELFEIAYDKPGRMSAGMACTIKITFTAIQTRDIDSELPALAQTGAFAIPLKCTCKKAVPVVEARTLVFQDVVAGEKQVLSVRLENKGALPLEYRVRAVGDHSRGGGRGGGGRGDDGDVEENDVPEVEEPMMEDVPPPQDAGVDVTQQVDEAQQSIQDTGGGEEEEVSAPLLITEGDEPGTTEEEEGSASSPSLSAASSHASLSPSTVAFERVVLTQEEQGILDSAVTATQYKPEGADCPIRFQPHGLVAPYSSISISFTFAPDSPMSITDVAFAIEFPGVETTFKPFFWSAALLAPIPISISAQSTHVPIYVATPVLDMQCCLYDRLYRQQVAVCNRGSVALKLQLHVPKALEDCVECHPNMGYVQGRSAASGDGRFPIQIKFRPCPGMWKHLEAKGFGSQRLGYLAVPIQVVVPDQVIPVYFVFTARLASPALTFSRTKLVFGQCALGHSVAHTLAITNTSRLPQRFAFVKLPHEIHLQSPPDSTANPSDDGLATMLPGEVRSFTVVYQPNASTTTLHSRLTCRTTTNDEYSITVTGECIVWPVAFSETVVQLGATQLGQWQCHGLTCSNSSDKQQTIELLVPPQATGILRVTPSVVAIPPRGSVRVEIEFNATEEVFGIDTSTYEAQPSETASAVAFSVVRNASRESCTALPKQLAPIVGTLRTPAPPWARTEGVEGEERSVHHTWSVLCFRQHQQASGVPMALQIRTTVIDAVLFATPKDLTFGQVAIGQTLIKELVFTNNSPQDVLLKAKALHAFGGFRIINSLQRTIPSHGGQRVFKVEFQPTAPLLYDEELEVSCPEVGVIRMALRGEGVNPSLKIHPENGLLDFNDVLARNRSISEFQLTNASAFPLTFSIIAIGEPGTVTSSGLPAFTFTPSHATIPAQATLAVKVLFFPDHQRPQHYKQQFLIQVPNESERHVVTVVGRCWENQVYVYNPHETPKLFVAPPVEDFFDLPPSVTLTSLLGAAGSGLFNLALAAPGIKKAPSPLTVVFDGDVPGAESKAIFIGATQPPSSAMEDESVAHKPQATAAGTFEFAIEENPDKPQYAKMFTLEPMKGIINMGQQQPIQLSYTPPAPPSSSSSDGDDGVVRMELVVSQWIQVKVSCTLKGGALWRHLPAQPPAAIVATSGKAPAPAASAGADAEMRTVQLVLRAKLHL